MSRETELLQQAFEFASGRANMINAHLIKARAAASPIAARQRHLDDAIELARSVMDELVTKRMALGWHNRRGAA